MRSASAIRSPMSAVLAGALAVGLVLAGAGCGGKSKGTAPLGNGGGGPNGGGLAARLPWEAALTEGATFTLTTDIGEGDGYAPVTVKVVAVEEDGGARVYRLDWGEEGANGPTTIRVQGTTVTINDAEPARMQEPYSTPGSDAICYGEDFSNPEGCEDVCDADLCLSPTGIDNVGGLYAPDYGIYSRK